MEKYNSPLPSIRGRPGPHHHDDVVDAIREEEIETHEWPVWKR